MEFDNIITLNGYQAHATKTAQYEKTRTFEIWNDDISYTTTVPEYPFVKIGAEASEISDLFAKRILRGDNNGVITRQEMIKELGDTLWYISECAKVMNCRLSFVAQENLRKLHTRLLNNTIKGSGDNR